MIDELYATVETVLKQSYAITSRPKLKAETTESKKLKKGCSDSELQRLRKDIEAQIEMLNKVKNGLDELRSTDRGDNLPLTDINSDGERFPSLASSSSNRADNDYVNDNIIIK